MRTKASLVLALLIARRAAAKDDQTRGLITGALVMMRRSFAREDGIGMVEFHF